MISICDFSELQTAVNSNTRSQQCDSDLIYSSVKPGTEVSLGFSVISKVWKLPQSFLTFAFSTFISIELI